VIAAIEAYPENMMFETDFPHPTCQHPGPATPAVGPQRYIAETLSALSDETRAKVLSGTAARLYRVE